jgi:4-hydroxybenzoyl-CoA reductase subunit beta
MMRLPPCGYVAPATLAEAAAILEDEGPEAAILAGGTDLLAKMKRRQQRPRTLVGLRRIAGLRGVRGTPGAGLRIGAMTTLAELERHEAIRAHYPGLHQALRSIATPLLRNAGTIGGNLCLDTRCNYYDQTWEWRRAINFCMKCDGDVCWVAPGSDVCLAVASSDAAPVLCAFGARLVLAGARGERTIEAKDLYRRDGIRFLAKDPAEIVAAVLLPPAGRLRSSYSKLRRRGSFDFPVLGVAACLRFDRDVVADARLWLTAVSMAPVRAEEAERALVGRPLTGASIEEAAEGAWARAKPVDNTDFTVRWRKEMTRHHVRQALGALT